MNDMSEFWIYLEMGLRHVLNIKAYDRVLFLMVLTVSYAFKDWKRVLLLVSIVSIGHASALLLSVFDIVMIKASLVEFLIPVTILITALFGLFSAGKSAKADNINVIGFITLFFGVIHGLEFSNYFKSAVERNPSNKMIPLLELELGIALGHIIVVVGILLISFVFQNFLRFSKRDFTLVFSAFVIGVIVPMILKSNLWN